MKREWNISYAEADLFGNAMDSVYIALPSFWKALFWFIRKGRQYEYIYIWTSERRS